MGFNLMRNRAKCKLCEDVIESTHTYDFVACRCGQISVDGGSDYNKCSAEDWINFLRVDDEGNIVVPIIKDREAALENQNKNNDLSIMSRPTKEELLDVLDETIKNIENLPIDASLSPVTHADFSSLLTLLSSIFRAD